MNACVSYRKYINFVTSCDPKLDWVSLSYTISTAIPLFISL